MNCKAVQSRLSAYLDRELTGEELLNLRAHISECSECRHEESELRQLKMMLGQLSTPDPSDDLADRLCASVLQQGVNQSRSWHRSAFTFAGVAACSMIATLVAISVQSDAPQAQSVEPNLAYDVMQDQAYSIGTDATGGAPVISVSNYAGR